MDLTRPNPGAKAHKRLLYGLLGAVIGLVSFLILYGSVPLDVTNDSWIFYWYDEPDIVERYSGWVNLRASDWSFPLAYTDNTAYPDGVIVSFMDSMPWVCVFFKLLSPLLPQTFQFEGIYLLLAFILQGMAACLLLSRKTDSWIFLAGGTALFTFSPILLERGFRHTSLASHYLILLAILLWLTFRDKLKEQKRGFLICLVLFSLLSFLSVGITPYFIPMVLCFALLSVVDYCRLSSDAAGWKALKGAGFLTSSCAAVLAGGWLLGTLGSGVSPSRTGYGEFSLNLNGLFNPSSTGGYTWSRIIPEQPQSFYQFDGFNYLGAGLLLLLAVVLCVSTVTLRKNGRKFLIVLWENLWVVLACLCLTMFAVSNLITFGDQLLLEIPLSPELLSLCNIFRGSSRLFWPVYYLLMLGGLYWCAGLGRRAGLLLLILVCCVQGFDLSAVVMEKHTYFQTYQEEPAMEFLAHPEQYDEMIVTSSYSVYMARSWGAFCGKNGIVSNFVSANSGEYPGTQELAEQAALQLDRGFCPARTIIYTEDAGQYRRWMELYADTDCRFYDREWRGAIHFIMTTGQEDIQAVLPGQS